MLTLIHNKSCSKSNCLYNYLRDNNIPFTLRHYLEDPLTTAELEGLIKKIDEPHVALVRVTEKSFREMERQPDLTDIATVVKLLHHNPAWLQRPILVFGDHAVIGRPLEKAIQFVQRSGIRPLPKKC